MRDIARGLNLQGSSLYAHIQGKEELLRDIVLRAAQAFLDAAGRVDASLPAPQRLRALARGHIDVIAHQLPNATVFFHEWTHLAPAAREHVVTQRDAYQAHFREVIDAGIESGSFKVADPGIATLFVLSALNWTYQWLDPEGRLSLHALAERYADLLLSAVGAGGSSGQRGE
jgi:AcrR family transcriptional regulator